MTTGTKHRIGFKQTAVELIDGSFGQQNMSVPPGLLAHNAITVANTATQIVAENTGRITVRIANTGNATVYLGGSDVTTANGFPLATNTSIELATTAAIYGIVATGTINVRFLELTN